MTDRVFLILLCVFLLLYGLQAVTNFRFEWMGVIAGFAALIAGAVGLVRAFAKP
jgi:hypothetical protein